MRRIFLIIASPSEGLKDHGVPSGAGILQTNESTPKLADNKESLSRLYRDSGSRSYLVGRHYFYNKKEYKGELKIIRDIHV
jgi:hypothetical protein